MTTSHSHRELLEQQDNIEENNHLLESFDTPEPEDGNQEFKLKYSHSQHSLNEVYNGKKFLSDQSDDDRLQSTSSIQQHETTPREQDNEEENTQQQDGLNGALREGNSSSHPDSNGSSDQVDLELQQPRRLTTSQRIKNVIHHLVPIKQTYERINNGITTGRMQSNTPGRFIGQGTDGVFRNLMAKPDTESNRIDQENNPPSYEEAAADASPEYWESTVISPMYEDEVFVEGLPVGNIANFVWNGLVTVAFQFVGFILCYLLHTSHAAKQGSRVGLGITFMVYGYGMVPSNFGNPNRVPDRYEPSDPNLFDINKSLSISTGGKLDTYKVGLLKGVTSVDASQQNDPSVFDAPYFAYGLIAFGLFIIIKAIMDYYRVKQMERVILSPPTTTTTTTTANSS